MSPVKTVTLASDHVIAIGLALDMRIEYIELQIAIQPDDMYWRDALDVATQSIEMMRQA